jgi:hypothetical protein
MEHMHMAGNNKDAPEVADPRKQPGPEVKDPRNGNKPEQGGGQGSKQPEVRDPTRGPALF